MRRILAEVIESTDLGPIDDESGLPWREFTISAKLLSSVPESHHLPEDAKDSTCTITRRAIFDREYMPGTKLVLTPDECARLVGHPPQIPEPVPLRGKVTTYRTDIDADGFAERVVENAFVRVVIAPRFGARILQITHKRPSWNALHATFDFSRNWLEVGGQEDIITEQGDQGEFWNAPFTEKELITDDKSFRAVYEFKSEKSKGLTFTKTISVPIDAPVVSFHCSFKYSGAEKLPEGDKPDEFEMSYWPRVGISVPHADRHDWLYIMPGMTGLKTSRHDVNWETTHAFKLTAPYHFAQNESTGLSLALIMDPETVRKGMVWHSREFSTLEPKMKPVKVPKGGEQNYGFAVVLGDAARADEQSLAITATGPVENGATPYFALTTVSMPGPAVAKTDDSAVSIDLVETEYSGLPKIAQGTSWITGKSGIALKDLSLDGRRWDFCPGGAK